jgi:hypothetical protein
MPTANLNPRHTTPYNNLELLVGAQGPRACGAQTYERLSDRLLAAITADLAVDATAMRDHANTYQARESERTVHSVYTETQSSCRAVAHNIRQRCATCGSRWFKNYTPASDRVRRCADRLFRAAPQAADRSRLRTRADRWGCREVGPHQGAGRTPRIEAAQLPNQFPRGSSTWSGGVTGFCGPHPWTPRQIRTAMMVVR